MKRTKKSNGEKIISKTTEIILKTPSKPSEVEKEVKKGNGYRPRSFGQAELMKKRFLELFEEDTYTLSEICNAVGIQIDTYYKWLKEDKEFEIALNKATQMARMKFNVVAKNSLRRLIEGYVTKEITITERMNKNGEIYTLKTEVTKEHKPDTAAVIFTLTNVDPDNWKNRQNISGEITNNNVVTFEELEETMKDLSDEQLNALKEIALSVKKLKNE